nr:unnamed protein product [Callosobruchus chinensis]
MMSKKQLLLVLCLFVIYLLLGAAIFLEIEIKEEGERNKQDKFKRQQIEKLLKDHYEGDTQQVRDIFSNLTEYCGKPINYNMSHNDPAPRWDYYHSLFFVITVVSTIGYGNLAPTTTLTRIFMILYGLIGIPMNGIIMVTLGEYFAKSFKKLYVRWKNTRIKRSAAKLGLIGQIVLYAVPGLTFFIFLPSTIISVFEQWDYDVALYYSFVTLTTIGFGDYVAEYIWDSLYEIHIPVPSNGDFQQITKDFYEIWNFPNCIGALDGKHIRMRCPNNSGSLYFNYKGYFSIVLQALVDANYKFINIDVGGYGKQSDGGTFKASALYRKIINGTLNLPEDSLLPNSNLSMPHVIIADEAYPLMRNLLKPYSKQELNEEKEYFNKRLSRARRTVECAFGIIRSKWQILDKPILTSAEHADKIIKTVCLLHNIIINKEGIEHNLRDIQSTFQNENIQAPAGRPNSDFQDISRFSPMVRYFYQIFLLVWIIGGLGYVVMVIGFITQGMRSRKLVQIEKMLADNIRKTPQRIRNELRTLLHELLFMRVKPVYKGEFEYVPHVLEHSQSCPELRLLGLDEHPKESPNSARKRAMSECYPLAMTIVAPTAAAKMQSETELERIDKERTFKPSDAFMQQKDLLLKVVDALSAQRFDDGGINCFSDQEILASENLTPRRRRAASDSLPSTPMPLMYSKPEGGYTWYGNDATKASLEFSKQRRARAFSLAATKLEGPSILKRIKNRFNIKSKDEKQPVSIDIEKQNLESQYLKMPTSRTPDSTKDANGPTSLPTDPAALLTDRVLEQTSIADFIRALSAIAVPEDATAYLREQQPKRKVGVAR